jgi:hypothetical protein
MTGHLLFGCGWRPRYELLPDTGKVVVDIPAQAPGTRMFFTCSMGMYTGLIEFE